MTSSHRIALGLLIVTCTGAMACSSPSAVCDINSGITGRWSYEATQEVPVRAQISGSMVISSANCVDFQGVLDAVEVLATGESRRVGGLVSGTIVAASLIRFEAVVGDGTREHIARLAADSLAGEWVQSAGSIPGNGRFGAHRAGAL
jgi:hypothetical protein